MRTRSFSRYKKNVIVKERRVSFPSDNSASLEALAKLERKKNFKPRKKISGSEPSDNDSSNYNSVFLKTSQKEEIKAMDDFCSQVAGFQTINSENGNIQFPASSLLEKNDVNNNSRIRSNQDSWGDNDFSTDGNYLNIIYAENKSEKLDILLSSTSKKSEILSNIQEEYKIDGFLFSTNSDQQVENDNDIFNKEFANQTVKNDSNSCRDLLEFSDKHLVNSQLLANEMNHMDKKSVQFGKNREKTTFTKISDCTLSDTLSNDLFISDGFGIFQEICPRSHNAVKRSARLRLMQLRDNNIKETDDCDSLLKFTAVTLKRPNQNLNLSDLSCKQIKVSEDFSCNEKEFKKVSSNNEKNPPKNKVDKKISRTGKPQREFLKNKLKKSVASEGQISVSQDAKDNSGKVVGDFYRKKPKIHGTTGFMVWVNEEKRRYQQQNQDASTQLLSDIMISAWRKLSEEEKDRYTIKAIDINTQAFKSSRHEKLSNQDPSLYNDPESSGHFIESITSKEDNQQEEWRWKQLTFEQEEEVIKCWNDLLSIVLTSNQKREFDNHVNHACFKYELQYIRQQNQQQISIDDVFLKSQKNLITWKQICKRRSLIQSRIKLHYKNWGVWLTSTINNTKRKQKYLERIFQERLRVLLSNEHMTDCVTDKKSDILEEILDAVDNVELVNYQVMPINNLHIERIKTSLKSSVNRMTIINNNQEVFLPLPTNDLFMKMILKEISNKKEIEEMTFQSVYKYFSLDIFADKSNDDGKCQINYSPGSLDDILFGNFLCHQLYDEECCELNSPSCLLNDLIVLDNLISKI